MRPAQPSTIARATATHAALDEFQHAIAIEPDAHSRAQVMHMIGNTLQAWNLPWEAWIWQSRAAATDPSVPLYAKSAEGLLNAMHDPTRMTVFGGDSALARAR
jgi:hypothetical protein